MIPSNLATGAMRPTMYVLAEDGKTPIPGTALEWEAQRKSLTQIVGKTIFPVLGDEATREYFRGLDGQSAEAEIAASSTVATLSDTTMSVRVSTVFLGIDHGYSPGPPVLWETMIFIEAPMEIVAPDPYFAGLDEYQTRYSSHDEAVAGHEEACALVRSALAQRAAVLRSLP